MNKKLLIQLESAKSEDVDHLLTFLKGFAMGAANIIPGVSGGTIAFITGIYERLINAIKAFDAKALKLLKNRELAEFWKHIDGTFLTALVLGVFVSIVGLAFILEPIMEHPVHKIYLSAFFFGLILASIWSVYKMVKKWGSGAILGLLIGCAVAVSLAFLPHAKESDNLFYLMLCGVVAMCSMIVPGISGSFMLILLGNYKLIMVDSVNNLRAGDMNALSILIPVGLGAVVGMALLARFLSWLFKKYHDVAVASITGFIAGSLVTIWPWKKDVVESYNVGDIVKEKTIDYERYIPSLDGNFYLAIGAMLGGVIIMVAVEMMGNKKNSVK